MSNFPQVALQPSSTNRICIPILTPREHQLYHSTPAEAERLRARDPSPLRLLGHNCVETLHLMIAGQVKERVEELEVRATEAMRAVRDHRAREWDRTGQVDEAAASRGADGVVREFKEGVKLIYDRMEYLHGPTHPDQIWGEMDLRRRMPSAFLKIRPAGTRGPLRWDLLDSKAELLGFSNLEDLQYSASLGEDWEEQEEDSGEPLDGKEGKEGKGDTLADKKDSEGNGHMLDDKKDSEDGDGQLVEQVQQGGEDSEEDSDPGLEMAMHLKGFQGV